MTIFHALILGIVQGLTEFLPISSSGHLIVFPELLGWPEQPLAFDTTLHLGTAAALIIYFYKDLVALMTNFIKDFFVHRFNFKKYSRNGKFGLKIILASIPAGILGFSLQSFLEATFRGTLWVALFMLLGTLLMAFAEIEYKSSKSIDTKESPTYLDSLFIGFFQSLALLSGVSRSGATISGGMLLGLKRDEAARFSFILSIPIILAAGLSQLVGLEGGSMGLTVMHLLVGFVASALVGYLAVDFLIKFLKTKSLWPFIVYRVVLFVFLIGFVVLR